MNVLMTGPGKGHNVHRFLEWFNSHSEEYNFFYHRYNGADHYDLKEFSHVHFISTFDFFKFVLAVRKADIIWVHNWTPWPFLAVIKAFRKKKSVLNFNFWSEKLPRDILAGTNSKSSFYRKFFASCDVLQTSWFSVKNLVDQFEHANSRLMRWGFEEEYFQPINEAQLSDFTTQFVGDLPADKFKFFVPKSIGFPNRHDLMVEAAAKLVAGGTPNFVIYFWKGNRVESDVEVKILDQIKALGVEEQVKLVSHPYLSNSDVAFIWQHMDCGLQLCDQDQLTSAFTEPQLFLKPVIASSIPSYTIYNEFYEVNIPLVDNQNVETVVDAMQSEINGQHSTSPEELKKRQTVITDLYRYSSNMEAMMSYFRSLLR